MEKKFTINLKGYVLSDRETFAVCCFIPISLVGISVYVIILFIEAFQEQNSIFHWLLASGFLFFLIIGCVNVYHYYKFYFMQFYIGEYEICNFVRSQTKNSLKLFDQLFISTVNVEFSFGRVEVTKTFYLFSERKVTTDDIDGSGIKVITRLYRSGIVIIPKSEEIDLWINSDLKINDLPNYPNSIIINQSAEEQLLDEFVDG